MSGPRRAIEHALYHRRHAGSAGPAERDLGTLLRPPSDIPQHVTNDILDRLAALSDYPQVGTPRDDVRTGLRTLAYRRRVTIAFMVEDAAVVVIGFYYGGQDFETLLREE